MISVNKIKFGRIVWEECSFLTSNFTVNELNRIRAAVGIKLWEWIKLLICRDIAEFMSR